MTELVKGDLKVGAAVTWLWDGAAFRLIGMPASDVAALIGGTAGSTAVLTVVQSQFVITAPVSFTIGPGGKFSDLNAAFAWLSGFLISYQGSVTFNLAPGIGANAVSYGGGLLLQHVNIDRVFVVGAPFTGAFPAVADLTITGNSAAARASDATSNLALFRTRLATELKFPTGAQCAIVGNLGGLSNVLLTGDGSAADLLVVRNGIVGASQVVTHGSGGRGMVLATATMVALGSIINSSHASFCLNASDGGHVTIAAGASVTAVSGGADGNFVAGTSSIRSNGNGKLFGHGCAGAGNKSSDTSNISVAAGSGAKLNGGVGWSADSTKMSVVGADASNNALGGFNAVGGATIDATNSTGSGNGGFAYSSNNRSGVIFTGGACAGASGTASPGANTQGNGNSYNIQ